MNLVLGVYKSALWHTVRRDGHSDISLSLRVSETCRLQLRNCVGLSLLGPYLALKGESVRLASNSNERNSGYEIQRRFEYRTYTWNQRFVLTRRTEPVNGIKKPQSGTQTSRHIQFGLGPKPCLVRNDYYFLRGILHT